MFKVLKSAWQAGRSRQPLPAPVDRTTGGQTAIIAGVFGIAVIAMFGTAYAIGSVERKQREDDHHNEDDELNKLEADAKAAKHELSCEEEGEEAVEEAAEEENGYYPPGSAACPVCLKVFLDGARAADCCPDERRWDGDDEDEDCRLEQDMETGEITEHDDQEPAGAEDLWADHVND